MMFLKTPLQKIFGLAVFSLAFSFASSASAQTLTFTNDDLDEQPAAPSVTLSFSNDDLLDDGPASQPSQGTVTETTSAPVTDAPDIVVIDAGVKAPWLWKIEGPTPSYLFGTIHIPDPRVTTLQPGVQSAFDSSDAVYTEIPMGLMDMLRVAGMTALPPGKSLNDILDAGTKQRVNRLLTKYGLSLEQFQSMKVWALAAQLSQLDLLEELAKNPIVLDMKIYMDANAAGKEVGGLETPESQVAVFDELSLEEQITFLKSTLDSVEEMMEKGMDPSEQTVESYLEGDSSNLVQTLTDYMDFSDPFSLKLYDRLLTNRDRNMTDRIDRMITDNPDKQYFFAVGALHLPRGDGIVGLMREKGYTVTRVTE